MGEAEPCNEIKRKIFRSHALCGNEDFSEECKVFLHEIPHSAGAREPCTPLFRKTRGKGGISNFKNDLV
jgi:hypothetical protein